mmetsp:Transcript_21673/g.50861  ORF Transcript_21673/g.50861 Transcript_21673/m.50861 type:complete len:196 (-) Transcript_21673:596-1183(-)
MGYQLQTPAWGVCSMATVVFAVSTHTNMQVIYIMMASRASKRIRQDSSKRKRDAPAATFQLDDSAEAGGAQLGQWVLPPSNSSATAASSNWLALPPSSGSTTNLLALPPSKSSLGQYQKQKVAVEDVMIEARRMWRAENPHQAKSSSQEDRDFRELFGIGPLIAPIVWNLLVTSDLVPEGGKLAHFMWTLHEMLS